MIPSSIIEEIRGKSDIVKVVSEYVALRKRGRNYLGLCPFHPEKDASFTVSPEKQIFHCFGCNEGGNVFAFIMKIENISFAEAVEELGEKVNVAVPKAAASAARPEKEKLYQVMQMAAQFFEQTLKGPEGEACRAYLDKRGLQNRAIDLFRLGFVPTGWDHLFKYLVGRGVAPEQIEKCGLAIGREGKNDYYDRFRNRLVFPVVDPRGRIIAFGGRALGDEEPKYLNSPDTLIYQKGDSVFGLNLSRDSIKKQKSAVLVEGYFDLITPFQAGTTNIIASLGTALTSAQCKLIARYCENIVLAYDADAAGGIAAERSAELMKKEGLKVKIARLTGGKDPDEIIRKGGPAAFSQCLGSALPFLEFKIQRILAQKNLNEIEARAAALREIAALLSRESDPFVQKEYAKLFAPTLKIDPETLLSEIKRDTHYGRGAAAGNLRRVTAKPDARGLEAEKNLIALAAQDRTALDELKANLSVNDFKHSEARSIAEILFTAEITGDNLSHFLLENLPDEKARNFLSQIILRHPPVETAMREEIVRDCVRTIKEEYGKEKIADLKVEIKEAEKAGETEKAAELLNLLKSEIYEKSVR